MAEWLVEHGIGEDRAILVERDSVIAAVMHWPGEIGTGAVDAKLVRRTKGSARGLAITDKGLEINVSGLPREASEGSTISIDITRAPMAERGRYKRAQGVHKPTKSPRSDGEAITTPGPLPEGKVVRQFPAGLWEDLWADAWSGEVGFAGGSLVACLTPAMTVIDIDGDLPPGELALAAAPVVAKLVRKFDLGGSIGIDFPTLPDKAQRRAVDEALAKALADWPHERTAMNGFGFVQLVARLTRPSLLHRLHFSRAEAAARMLLRLAEHTQGTGPRLQLRVHPAVAGHLREDWIAELARRSGRNVAVEIDPALALEGGHAQILSA